MIKLLRLFVLTRDKTPGSKIGALEIALDRVPPVVLARPIETSTIVRRTSPITSVFLGTPPRYGQGGRANNNPTNRRNQQN